jgi:hypothetical protein
LCIVGVRQRPLADAVSGEGFTLRAMARRNYFARAVVASAASAHRRIARPRCCAADTRSPKSIFIGASDAFDLSATQPRHCSLDDFVDAGEEY